MSHVSHFQFLNYISICFKFLETSQLFVFLILYKIKKIYFLIQAVPVIANQSALSLVITDK
jgi:hypothetical protein